MEGHSDPQGDSLLEKVVETENMRRAWKQVKRNKGGAGVDGRDIGETLAFLRTDWQDIRRQLLEGTYSPYPVLRVEIPKPGGGVRKLGIPTVTDRVIQQAITQVLTPMFDAGFSESSFGFRLGRKVRDKRLKRLINAYLKAGVLADGCIHPTLKGTPQGGPLSPFLSNVLLDGLDKELERRGHSFCRYADDVNIYVRSQKAGDRTMRSITRYIEDVLKLKVNQDKSAVARPWKRSFLGFTFLKVWGRMRVGVADKSWRRFRTRVKDLLHMGRGRNMGRFIRETLNPVLRGWMQYFKLGASKQRLVSVDFWIRRHLRCTMWRQWKTPSTRFKRLLELGCPKHQSLLAYSRRGPWWCAGVPALIQFLPPPYFRQMGLYSLLENG